MPVYPCKHPTCVSYVAKRGDFCDAHAQQGKQERRQRDQHYDRHRRDPDAKRFYNSAIWKRARTTALAENPVCTRCRKEWAQHVHHRIPLKRCTRQQRTDQQNLMAVCAACHNAIEAEVAKCTFA